MRDGVRFLDGAVRHLVEALHGLDSSGTSAGWRADILHANYEAEMLALVTADAAKARR